MDVWLSPLTENTRQAIETLAGQGDAFLQIGRLAEAHAVYDAAWQLVPDPKVCWEISTALAIALGEVNFLSADYAAAREHFAFARLCPNGDHLAFLSLRIGQCHHKLGEPARAAEELGRALHDEGPELFQREDEWYLEIAEAALAESASAARTA